MEPSTIIQGLSFYMFAAITVASGVMVISSRNPVHSVLFLILAFFNSAGLFVLLGAEFLAMILVIVYVGAVAVLFMFVVMMLDIHFVEMRQGFLKYLPIGGTIGFILMVELLVVAGGWKINSGGGTYGAAPIPDPGTVTNTQAIGEVIYTHYMYLFQASGLVLLIAMIGAIVLTHRKRTGVRKQKISEQVARSGSIKIHKVKVGKGI